MIKKTGILLITAFFALYPVLYSISQMDIKGDILIENSMSCGAGFFLSYQIAAVARCMFDSLANAGSNPGQCLGTEHNISPFHPVSKDPVSSKSNHDTSSILQQMVNSNSKYNINLFTNNFNYFLHSATQLSYSVDPPVVMKKTRDPCLFILLIFMMFYLLPRGAIDNAFILIFNKGSCMPIL